VKTFQTYETGMPACQRASYSPAGRAGANLRHTRLLRLMANALWQAGKGMIIAPSERHVVAQGVNPG